MFLTSCSLALLLAGCGQTGTPQAPSLQLPTPVNDLTANRVGDRVTLTWTMPRRTTDKLPLKGLQPVQIFVEPTREPALPSVRSVTRLESPRPTTTRYRPISREAVHSCWLTRSMCSACTAVQPGPRISPTPQRDRRHLLSFTPAAKSPPMVSCCSGNRLRCPEAITRSISNGRSFCGGRPAQIRSQTASQSPLGGSGQSFMKQQTLVVRLPPGADPGKALDPDAAFDQRYSYRISRVTTVSIGGKSIDIAGPSSAEILVDTKDIFAAAAPTGLAAVAAPDSRARLTSRGRQAPRQISPGTPSTEARLAERVSESRPQVSQSILRPFVTQPRGRDVNTPIR